MDEVDFTVLAATSVFTDLMEKCPPAEACRDAFDRTVKATIKMANSTGGFGQNPRQHHRLDWSSSRATTVDTTSQLSGTSKHGNPHRGSIEQLAAVAADLSSVSDAYSNSASPSSLPPFKQHRLKNEPPETSSGFSMIRNLPAPRSNASGGSAENNPGATSEAIDPSLMGSPVGGQMNSPIVGMAPPLSQQPEGQLFGSSSGMGFGNLQGMDFLQSLEGGAGALDGTGDFGFGEQVDLGYGLGWEGLHHDFSEGQQVDLFDGFFFGGQQGNGGGGFGRE